MIINKSFERAPFFGSDISEDNARENEAESLRRDTVLKSNPVRVRLELTNKCNLVCVFCYRSHFRTDDKSELTPDDIDKLDPVLRTAKFISLQQKTESLVSPHIVEILDKVGKYDAVSSLNTNLLPLTEEMAEALVRNKVQFVSVSVSVFDESYKKIYRGGKFNDLVEKVELLNAVKLRMGSSLPRLRMSFVLRKDTVDQLEPALDFCKRYNFAEGIQVLSFFRNVEEDKHLEPALHWEEYEETWDRFQKRAEELGVPVEFSLDVAEGMREAACPQYVKGCFEPWESLNIAPSGNVMPCSQASQIMGNIRDDDVIDIWRNENYRGFREGMNGAPYNKDCAECYHCRFVSASVMGDKVSKREKIYDTYYRRGKSKRIK